MFSVISCDSINLQGLSNKILENKGLNSSLKITVKLLRSRMAQLQGSFKQNHNEENQLSPLLMLSCIEQQKLIRQLARDIYFTETIVSWEKKCGGHNVRVNPEGLKKSDAEKLIREYGNDLSKNTNIITYRGFHNKIRSNHYDVHFEFSHIDNSNECTSLPQEVSKVQRVFLSEIISQFENEIQKHHLDIFHEYEALFLLIML